MIFGKLKRNWDNMERLRLLTWEDGAKFCPEKIVKYLLMGDKMTLLAGYDGKTTIYRVKDMNLVKYDYPFIETKKANIEKYKGDKIFRLLTEDIIKLWRKQWKESTKKRLK